MQIGLEQYYSRHHVARGLLVSGNIFEPNISNTVRDRRLVKIDYQLYVTAYYESNGHVRDDVT